MKVHLAPQALRALLESGVWQAQEDPLVPQEGLGLRVPRVLLEKKVFRVRKVPLAQLAGMVSKGLWGYLVLLAPQVWQEKMETRVRLVMLDRRAAKETRVNMALLDPLDHWVPWVSLELRE